MRNLVVHKQLEKLLMEENVFISIISSLYNELYSALK